MALSSFQRTVWPNIRHNYFTVLLSLFYPRFIKFFRIWMNLREFSLISQKKVLEITTKQECYKVDLGSWEAMTRFSSKSLTFTHAISTKLFFWQHSWQLSEILARSKDEGIKILQTNQSGRRSIECCKTKTNGSYNSQSEERKIQTAESLQPRESASYQSRWVSVLNLIDW